MLNATQPVTTTTANPPNSLATTAFAGVTKAAQWATYAQYAHAAYSLSKNPNQIPAFIASQVGMRLATEMFKKAGVAPLIIDNAKKILGPTAGPLVGELLTWVALSKFQELGSKAAQQLLSRQMGPPNKEDKPLDPTLSDK